ncbi:MAG: ice-binding family protein [Thermoanaerobaculia bacterium]
MKQSVRNMVISGAFATLLFLPSHAPAATAPPLGTAASFSVLGASAVTNTGPTVVTGDLGISPNGASSVTGFSFSSPPGPGLVVGGTTHFADAVALGAQSDVTAAYNDLAGQACDATISADLGGTTLTPGVYCSATSMGLTGTLTLDAQGDSAAVWVFQIGSTLTTASNSTVSVINGGNACNVYWQVGSSATLGTTTQFAGNILALTSITLNTGANASGRLLARNGAVTLDTSGVAVCASCPVITLSSTPDPLPNGIVNSPYAGATITATGGSGPYTYTIVSGSLPAGLTLATSGSIAGTPTATGTFTFTVRATDSNGCFGSQVNTIIINPDIIGGCPAIALSPLALPAATAGVPYGPQTITASGGTAPYTFTITSGALLTGLSLSSPTATTVDISGTPSQSGSFTFTLTATDSNGCIGSRIYTALGTCPLITVGPTTLAPPTSGVTYSQTITASGGTPAYTFGVTSGALPAGLGLSSSGTLSGTPTNSGAFTFTITATDSVGCEGARTYTMTITKGIPTLDSLGLGVLLLLLAGTGFLLVKRFGS